MDFKYNVIDKANSQGIAELNVLHRRLFPKHKNFILKNITNENLNIMGVFSSTDELIAYIIYKLELEKNTCYISFLGTDDRNRKLGLGTSLIERLKQIAKELSLNIELSVRADNESVQRLYENLGFVKSGYVAEAYSNSGGFRYCFDMTKEHSATEEQSKISNR